MNNFIRKTSLKKSASGLMSVQGTKVPLNDKKSKTRIPVKAGVEQKQVNIYSSHCKDIS